MIEETFMILYVENFQRIRVIAPLWFVDRVSVLTDLYMYPVFTYCYDPGIEKVIGEEVARPSFSVLLPGGDPILSKAVDEDYIYGDWVFSF